MIGQKKKRKNFVKKTKEAILRKQKYKCKLCNKHMVKYDIEFDHKDGNNSNNKISNCRALHTRCHRRKHSKRDKEKVNSVIQIIKSLF